MYYQMKFNRLINYVFNFISIKKFLYIVLFIYYCDCFFRLGIEWLNLRHI